MKVTAVSFKECWRDEAGRWFSYGGFPLQMEAITSLFDSSDLLIVEKPRRQGGLPLPLSNVVPLRSPSGTDFRRKLSVMANLPHYVGIIARSVKSADVVHVPLPGDIPLLALMVAWVYGKPVLARYGGSWHANGETTVMNRVTRSILRLMARGRHVILATGDDSAQPGKGIEWIFSSAVSRSEVESIRPRLDRGLTEPPRLVYVGRLSPEKGVDILIRAAHTLSKRHPVRPTITLIGDGPDRRRLEQMVKELGSQDQVRFTGQLNRSQLSQELIGADICVQPSFTEAFSKAWIDAMLHGLPVITSTVGAARAVIGTDGERGWLVPPGDENAYADRLEAVLSGFTDWPALRRRCRSFAEGLTLEDWKERIGERCAQRWNWTFREGKLYR